MTSLSTHFTKFAPGIAKEEAKDRTKAIAGHVRRLRRLAGMGGIGLRAFIDGLDSISKEADAQATVLRTRL